MNTFQFPIDLSIIEYLSLKDVKSIKYTSHDSLKYIYYHNRFIKNNAAKIITKFFKYSHNLFICSRYFDDNLLLKIKNKNSTFYKNLKFMIINLLYFYEYDSNMAKSFIEGLNIQYKSNIVKKYIIYDNNINYSNYDLNKLLNIMDHEDISIIGF